MPKFDFSKFTTWCKAMAAAKSRDLVLSPPMCGDASVAHETKESVVVDGAVIHPAKPPTQERKAASASAPAIKERVPFTPEALAKMAKTPCKDHLAGKCKFTKCKFLHPPAK
jgi:hypothetical protein